MSEQVVIPFERPTLDQDREKDMWYWDISTSSNRVVRLSLSRFPGEKEKPASSWINLKLFKVQESEFRQMQQIFYRHSEFKKLFESLPFIMDSLHKSILDCPEKEIEKCETFKITDKEDAKFVNWFWDFYTSQRRKMRVSHIIYDVKDPVTSSYVQLKLFTRASDTEEFIKKYLVNMKFEEFALLLQNSEGITSEVNTVMDVDAPFPKL